MFAFPKPTICTPKTVASTREGVSMPREEEKEKEKKEARRASEAPDSRIARYLHHPPPSPSHPFPLPLSSHHPTSTLSVSPNSTDLPPRMPIVLTPPAPPLPLPLPPRLSRRRRGPIARHTRQLDLCVASRRADRSSPLAGGREGVGVIGGEEVGFGPVLAGGRRGGGVGVVGRGVSGGLLDGLA